MASTWVEGKRTEITTSRDDTSAEPLMEVQLWLKQRGFKAEIECSEDEARLIIEE